MGSFMFITFFFGTEARGETCLAQGSRLGAAGSAKSRTSAKGGPSSPAGCHGWRQQSHPSAVACWTATLSIPHQRRSHPLRAAGRTAGATRRARWSTRRRISSRHSPLQRPPSSVARTSKRCAPRGRSSGYARCFRWRAVVMATASVSAARGMGVLLSHYKCSYHELYITNQYNYYCIIIDCYFYS